jgi:hypothetical protein
MKFLSASGGLAFGLGFAFAFALLGADLAPGRGLAFAVVPFFAGVARRPAAFVRAGAFAFAARVGAGLDVRFGAATRVSGAAGTAF